jgi:hypothetical protein
MVNYPTQDDLLQADPLDEWIDEHFLRPDPAAFAASGFRTTVAMVARTLEVDPNGIYCIGSGATGVSINPGKVSGHTLKAFDNSSDIDLAIVSEFHFEVAWRDLRRASQPLLKSEMELELAKYLSWQRKRFFDGVIVAHELLPYLSFGPTWVTALNQIAEHVDIALGRSAELNAWIFRDYWSLRTYITGGVLLCREKVI